MTPTYYRSRPQDVEAVQWDGSRDSYEALSAFVGELVDLNGEDELSLLAGKGGAQDWVPVPVGHWVVRNPGDNSDVWPVDPEYFDRKYGPVGDWVFSCPSCGSPSYKPWSLVTCDDDTNDDTNGETSDNEAVRQALRDLADEYDRLADRAMKARVAVLEAPYLRAREVLGQYFDGTPTVNHNHDEGETTT